MYKLSDNIDTIVKFSDNPGIETGYRKDIMIILRDSDNYEEKYRSKKHNGYHRCYDNILDNPCVHGYKPFISYVGGFIYINESDWIVTFKDSSTPLVLSDNTFKLLFDI